MLALVKENNIENLFVIKLIGIHILYNVWMFLGLVFIKCTTEDSTLCVNFPKLSLDTKNVSSFQL